ncbi:MAG: methyl-accepting chemotaxis protein [Gammaproteobacteria bacterium]
MLGIYNFKNLNHSNKIEASLLEDHRTVDNLMMKVLLAHWVIAATAMGIAHGTYLFGAISGAAIYAFAYVSKRSLSGTAYFRLIVAACFMLFSALYIQQNLGRIEMHFHVFVALAILARYKDILPQVSALTTILIHHLIINYCQGAEITALGAPLTLFNYGTGLDIIFIHAVFATMESVMLGVIIYQITQQYCENLNTSFDNMEVISTLDNVITNKDLTSKVSKTNKYAHLVNDLLDLINSNTSLRSALDKASVSLMLTNQDFEIVDCNSTVKTLFDDSINEIKSLIPTLDCDMPNGTSIKPLLDCTNKKLDYHHLNKQENLQVEIGKQIFKVIINPIRNDLGTNLGFIIEWQDHTGEFKIENEINNIVAAAKAGDLSKRINLENKQGFFARLSDGINDMITVVETNLDDIANTVVSMSKGDLSNHVSTTDKGRFAEVRESINDTLINLEDMVRQIQSASTVITSSSQDITTVGDNLMRRAENQSASLEETAASMEEMTSTVKNNADNAREASDLSSTSTEQAQHGGVVVKSAIEAMHEINTSSNKIASITNVIDEIAFQTNLLALNAAVEAARAGEQGRGFAVVATEVRNLAQRSATAAREIKDLIEDSVVKIKNGNQLVDESGKVLEQVVTSVSQVNHLMSEIASANQEQSLGIEQVNTAINQMDEMTQKNTRLVQDTTKASAELFEQANKMNSLMNFFSTSDTGSSTEETSSDIEFEHRQAS